MEETASHPQEASADQMFPLQTGRVTSSIPRGSSAENTTPVPKHQADTPATWVYPSEQQYYNAIKKKGWKGVDPSTIPYVLAVHNSVNEASWSKIIKYEADTHPAPPGTSFLPPRLVRFLGRPTALSPKAFVNTYLLGYTRPFDRHDWVVERTRPVYPHERLVAKVTGEDLPASGTVREETRFVIDFYTGQGGTGAGGGGAGGGGDNVNMFLDVRPALDSFTNFLEKFGLGSGDGAGEGKGGTSNA
ncbi:hypothetical protein TeGR_g4272 [Tetraparma gracilis]|uniref:Holocytochrome c-type synthase n=1 Tax=Tetraparma gracilis TaxID=2962635 RepID=A0ABQ6N554_9STRA|nr:hypothetical protein TeGR_g4272 [Tetraparma gracilis]